ncbi:hypothetical protein V1477_001073 [Vespula maculifrons]|uniref:Uncharacterized protein n=1 Tax=Vespula maculifrons TaxID=7453 RepID=A0ABD2D292_VESMC
MSKQRITVIRNIKTIRERRNLILSLQKPTFSKSAIGANARHPLPPIHDPPLLYDRDHVTQLYYTMATTNTPISRSEVGKTLPAKKVILLDL